MYSSRGSNAYGQQSYAGQSAYGQNVSLFFGFNLQFTVPFHANSIISLKNMRFGIYCLLGWQIIWDGIFIV